MLQLTAPPAPTAAVPGGPSLADVEARLRARIEAGDLARATGESYLGALRALAERRNLPLARIPADPERLAEMLPPDGFDPARDASQRAYALRRRRVLAAAREFAGLHAEQRRLRAQSDEWTELLAVLEPRTKGLPGARPLHPMKLAALKAFALVARAQGWQPRDLDAQRAAAIDETARGTKRAANRRCLARLDEIRRFPEALPLLPPRPIGFRPGRRQPQARPLPPAIEAALAPWIEAATRSGWDPVTETWSDDRQAHARVLRAALRTFFRIALELEVMDPGTRDPRAALASDDVLRAVAREMFARRHRSKAEGRLEPRTSRKYLKGLRQVLDRLGADTTLLSQIIANNRDSRDGARAERRMTPKNRRFCEMLIRKPHLRRRFLFSHLTLREAAEAALAAAKAEGCAPAATELARARRLGAAACFAALEIGGAPIRVEDAMSLTCVGEDAMIRIPKGGRPIEVHVPEALTKNGRAIRFPVRRNRHGCHDAIRWYAREIRPLFPHAAQNPHLFPAIRRPDRHLDPGSFGEGFAEAMRNVVDLPMTPHQMRHGQTSLLLDAHPGEIQVIAERIGDRVETLRTYYGWLDSLKLVERGQDLLVGLMDD